MYLGIVAKSLCNELKDINAMVGNYKSEIHNEELEVTSADYFITGKIELLCIEYLQNAKKSLL